MEFSEKLHNEMEKVGIYIEGDINWMSREFQRFSCKNYRNKKKHLFVVLLNGGASFGDWRDPSSWKTVWEQSWRDLNKEEKIRREESIFRLKRERELLQSHAIFRSSLLLNHRTWHGETCMAATIDNAYAAKKKVNPYYGLQLRSYLILPIIDIHHNLQSLQYIKPNGFKQFKKNASPKNGMVWLSEPLPKDYRGVIRVCEGYATGCSIYESIGGPVVCALSASNLESIAIQLRTKYVLSQIKICGDNDYCNKQNIGLHHARRAAIFVGGTLHYPIFEESHAPNKPSDFNDLFCLKGIEETEKQLLITRK